MRVHVLETDRLTIRPWHVDDAERLLEIRAIPEVAKWLSRPDAWTELAEALDAIERWNAIIRRDHVLGHWAVVPRDSALAGAVSLQLTPDGLETTIGWYLHPEASGRGYAREASQALLAAALQPGGPSRIWAVIRPENEVSSKLARALGMTDLGVIDDPWYGEPGRTTSRMFCSYATGEVPADLAPGAGA